MNKENQMQHRPIQFYKPEGGSQTSSQGAASSAATMIGKSKSKAGSQNMSDSNDMLPEIGTKYSSWAKEDQNLNELDELLMDHDLLGNPDSAARQVNRSGISATVHVRSQANRASSPDQFDVEEVLDEFGGGEVESGQVDMDDSRKNRNGNTSDNKAADDSNSFDLDNSDDLNRFIQKYETMLDGDGSNKKSNPKIGENAGLAKQQNSSGAKQLAAANQQRTLTRDRSKDLEESWGSLQLQAEQMLGNAGGEIEDETSPFDKKPSSSTNVSVSTASAAAQHKIEEEIIAEEIRLAQQQQQQQQIQSVQKVKNFTRRRSSDMPADMVEDFENEYLDDEAFKDEDQQKDDGIVDEVEEEDALRMIDEEIMNTAVAKHDARKLKDLIHKIDGAAPRGGGSDANTPDSGKNSTGGSDSLTSSGNFKSSKPVDHQTKFSSSSKVVVSKYSKSSSKQNLHESNSIFAGRRTPGADKKYDNEPEEQDEPEDHRLEPLGGSEDDIDEFIKRHLQDEESKQTAGKGGDKSEEEKDAMLAKAKELLGEGKIPSASKTDQEAEMMEEPLSDSDGSEDIDGDQLTPKQSLLNGLVRLGNPRSKKYQLAEREHFVCDLENILKILTFKETVAFIFPVLDVYAAEEQEYLKIELFKQLPHVFKKLMKSPARPSDQDALDLLTVNIFPLISQILMTSDDQVQSEGVQALFKISEDYLPKDEAIFLVFNVVQLLTKKSDQIDNAKIAVLMLIEKFASADYFTKKECMIFLNTSFASFMEGALFKIKKQMLPCLLAISKHIDYQEFLTKVLGTYMNFSSDSIWGVRRVCIELLPDFLEKIQETETDKLIAGLDFLQRSLTDDSRWVKNQAFLQFGKAVHAVYLKAQKPNADKQTLQVKITEVSNNFLNLQQIKGHLGASISGEETKGSKTKLSMSSNAQDEIDKIKECWAFNFPCVLLVNGGKPYWTRVAKAVYAVLTKDILINVRKSLAASLIEISKLIDLKEDLDENDDRTFMVEVANNLLSDADEIKLNLLPNLCEFVSLFPEDNQKVLLNSMIRERLEDEGSRKTRTIRIKLIIQLFETFEPQELVEAGFHQYLYESIKNEQMVGSRFALSKVFGNRVVAKLIRQKKYRKDLTDYVDSLRQSTNFRDRQMYIAIAEAAYEVDEEIYKKHFAKSIGNEMIEEKVTVVKMRIAKLAEKVPMGYSKSTDKIAEHLKAQGDSEVNQFFSQDNTDIGKRRYLDPATITTKMKAEEEDEEEKKAAAAETEAGDVEESKKPPATQSTEESKQAKKPADASGEQSEADKSESTTTPALGQEGEELERKEIAQLEKTVSIRLCNYSMLVRAQQFSSGLSAQLMALLGGYGSLLFGGGDGNGKGKMLDEDEENMLQAKKAAAEEEEKKAKEAEEEEDEEGDEEDDDTW